MLMKDIIIFQISKRLLRSILHRDKEINLVMLDNLKKLKIINNLVEIMVLVTIILHKHIRKGMLLQPPKISPVTTTKTTTATKADKISVQEEVDGQLLIQQVTNTKTNTTKVKAKVITIETIKDLLNKRMMQSIVE